jgi:transmembrane sensor
MLSRALDARVDEEDVRRVWRGIEPRLVQAAHRPRAWGHPLALGGVLAALVAVVAIGATRSEPTAAPFLALADGSAPAAITTSLASTVSFADGSHIELSAGSELVPTRNDARELGLRLTRGRARFVVTPGGHRRWQIDAGLATVEVIGTVFVVDRTAPDLHVSVERGHVRVSASDERHWDLLAGDDVWVASPPVAVASSPTFPPPAEALSATPVATARDRSAQPHRTVALDEEPGEHDEIASASPRELMLLADVARLSGRPTDAIEPLAYLVEHHPESVEASLAAVMLGRVAQDASNDPAAAARAFERAEALGVPASLADDVEGRLALAYLATGDARGVERARHYLETHPDGRHASALRARVD